MDKALNGREEALGAYASEMDFEGADRMLAGLLPDDRDLCVQLTEADLALLGMKEEEREVLRGISGRELRYVVAFLSDPVESPRAAAEAIGFPASKVCVIARRPQVVRAIEYFRRRAVYASNVTIERVIQELATIAFADVGEAFDELGALLPVNKMPASIRKAISGVQQNEITDKVDIKNLNTYNKISALKLLAEYLGMVGSVNRVPGGAGGGNQVQVNINLSGRPADGNEQETFDMNTRRIRG